MSKRRPDAPPDPTRRRALVSLGLLGAGGAAAACEPRWKPARDDPFSRPVSKAHVPGAERWASGEERAAITTCGQCEAGCGLRVRVVEGRAVSIAGNPESPINRGGVGPRGLSSLQALYDPDRIRGPLLRRGGTLEPVSWDQALARVAEALLELRSAGTPEKLLILSGKERGLDRDLLERFATAFGTPNFVDGRPSRSSAIAQATESALGRFDRPAYHWHGVRYVLGLEAGFVESSCQSVYFSRMRADTGQHGTRRASYTHCGATLDLAAFNADQWLRIEPGTSGALALGVCNALLADGTYDAVFASDRWSNFEAFRSDVAAFDPARVSTMTGVDADDIRRIAREMWQNRPSFALIDDRSAQTSNGLFNASAALALNALLGAIGAPSGGVFPAHRAPLAAWPEHELDDVAERGLKTPRLDGAGGNAFPRARSLFATLPQAIDDHPPGAVILHYANPVFARAQPQRWLAALGKAPLVVSLSPYLDETTAETAHVVLPDHTALERDDLVEPAPALDRAVVAVRQPTVVPLHDTRHSADVVLDLARRLGGGIVRSLPWRDHQHLIGERLAGLRAADRGSIRADSDSEFLRRMHREGVWVDSTVATAPETTAFSAAWEPPRWSGDEARFPLKLYLYRGLADTIGGGANLPWLHTMSTRPGERPWKPLAAVHPDSAPGVRDGDTVTLESAWGTIELRIRLERRMVPGVVAVPLVGGHTAMGRYAAGLGDNAMRLCAPQPAPQSGASPLCATRVNLRRGGHRG